MTTVDQTAEAGRPSTWAAHATALWALVFGLFHLYWALGGRFGLGDGDIDLSFHNIGFLVYDLVVVGMCAWGTVVSLALVRPVWRERTLATVGRVGAAVRVVPGWRESAPLWTLTASAWTGAVLLILRGVLGTLPQSVTGQTNEKVYGVAHPSDYTVWSIRIVEGFFLLGGVLFALMLLQYYRGLRARA